MPGSQNFQGLITATFTPFDGKGRVDLERIDAYAEHLVAARLSGVFVCGTTGESLSLTVAERKQIAARWKKALRGRLPLIVHVAANAWPDAAELAGHAQEIGAQAIAAHAPSYFKPRLPELVAWCAQVAAAAPGLPFYYYHIPVMTGVVVPVAEFIAAAGGQIPTLAGVKFTHEDLLDLQNTLRIAQERYQVLFGRDEMLLAGLALGCQGAVGSTYNFMAPVFHRVLDAYRRADADAARQEQRRAAHYISIMARHGGLAAGKAIMALVGMDCGPTRLPLRTLAAPEQAALRHDLDQAGFFQYGAA